MNARGELLHVSESGIVVTFSTVGDRADVLYAVVWRSGPDVTDVLTVEHVESMTKNEHYRSSKNLWRHT